MNEKVSMLKEKAKELRKTALTMIFEAQSGHPGGSLSSADIVTALYFSEMHVDPGKIRSGPTGTDLFFQRAMSARSSTRRSAASDFSRRKCCTPCVRKALCFRVTPACSNARA